MSRDPVFGVLNVDKPAGVSSRRVVDRVQRIVRPAKSGHAGTLDPLATGVLVVCVGSATRLISRVQEMPKTYRVTFLLGRRSPTDDLEAETESVIVDVPPTEANVRELLPRFTGRIEQRPPAFSAVKIDGERAYKLARRGDDVAVKPRTVEIHALDLLRFEYPLLELDVVCGSGTYIRSLGRDLGDALGCGAVMQDLRRTAIGDFTTANALPLGELTPESFRERLQSAVVCVPELPRHECSPADVDLVRNGRPIACGAGFEDDAEIAVIGPAGGLVCLARYVAAARQLAPKQVFPESS